MRKSSFLGRLALAPALAIAAALALTGPATAADGKPAKKDSRAQSRPREATFTTTVAPATARPGEAVRYQITAKLDGPWHIYKYAKEGPENGPKYTTFDLFETSGLAPAGDWSAAPEPIKKKEPAFPDIPFLEYHEDEVTWSIALKVPADAAPGKKTIRCQIGYMICSDQNCSFPGQWTLPDAELTVTAPGPKARLASYRADDPAPASRPSPKVPDRRLKMPKVVRWDVKAEPADAKAGEAVELKVTAHLDEGWHIFQYAPTWDENGPKPTLFDAFDLGGLRPTGPWRSSREPIRTKDPNFPQIESLEEFEGEVTWTLPLAVPAGLAAGPHPLSIQAGFQICNATTCQSPGQWTLPAAAFAVVPGGAAAATPIPSAPLPAAGSATPPAPAEAKSPAPPAPVEPRSVGAAPSASAARSGPKAVSQIAKLGDAGLIGFLLACAGGGLLTLAMPCVWPMIPITVNFFVKQGQAGGGRATGLAIAYCASIIGIFTGLGVLISAVFGSTSLAALANNPWVNLGLALMLMYFGLNLLGLFEVRLPSFLLNASAQGEGRGGLIGVMFMALTLTITSFTCTAPVVGGLIVVAAGGSYLLPILGLATFATVVALPFFLLALAPGMLAKLPKSGDWMNTVKVVGGLVEIAAAFKFVNTAELGFDAVPEAAWCDETTMLTIWVAISAVCGIYLLGLFRTDHDHSTAGVGAGRIVAGAGFLFFALYLTPALFGQQPKGRIYDRLVVGLLPPRGSETKATSTDPEIAITEEKSKHGVVWGFSYQAALANARKSGKKILIDFTGVNCSNCRQMELSVLKRDDVAARMQQFETVALYTDFVPISSITQAQRRKLGDDNVQLEQDLTGESTAPNYVIVDPAGGAERVVRNIGGYVEPATFLDFLDKGLAGDASAPPTGTKAADAAPAAPGARAPREG